MVDMAEGRIVGADDGFLEGCIVGLTEGREVGIEVRQLG